MNFRIGQGYDVHRFNEDSDPKNTIRIGGVDIPHPYPLEAHSDGDVAIHALSDALLGALALGDIGMHFPEYDSQWEGIDSTQLLAKVYRLILDAGYVLVNADLTVIAQAPRLRPHVDTMRNRMADVLGVEMERISVKASTTERLGFIGRGEGIACQCVVLIST